MIITKSEQVSFWDVDETLVCHVPQTKNNLNDRVNVADPLGGLPIQVKLNRPMIRLLLEEIHRGGYVVVWSRGGYEWAANVVKALCLENKVSQVMSKPLMYADDKEIDKWLPYRLYLEPGTVYKK